MAFLRTLLILILLYYAFKMIVKFLLPFIAKRWVQKAQESFQKQQGFVDPEEAKKREGEVNFTANQSDNSNNNQSQKKEKLGDYVDFEEITEDKNEL